MNITIKDFMSLALEEAQKAEERGEVPIGAVIADPQKKIVVASAGNRTREKNDPTAHAEMLAIKIATTKIGSERLTSHHLFVTLEPCSMCASAISFARIQHLYIGAYDFKSGGVLHGARIFDHPTCHHRPEITSGHRENECNNLLKLFFAKRRLVKI